MPITVEVEPPFKILYDLPVDTNLIICIGARAGMKTYEVSKWAAFNATIKKKREVILRDEASLIKESILNEIWERYDTANGEDQVLDRFFMRNETELKDRKTGKTLIYTKGFRASANVKRTNLKGPSDVDIAIIEEMEDVTDPDKFNTFIDGLRKEGCLVVLMLNTPDIGHFVIKRYFNLELVEDGYWKIHPKGLPGIVTIITDHWDNPHLPKHIRDRYEAYGDPSSHLYNKHYYLTAIKGYASSGRKGQVLTKVKPIKLVDYLALPFKEIYGQDFGTASPAGMVGVKFDGNRCYFRQLNYLPMNWQDIGVHYCQLNLDQQDRIIADHADKTACDKLSDGFTDDDVPRELLEQHPQLRHGFYIIRCVKGQDAIRARITKMDGMELYCVEESTDFWNEIYNYVYAQDKYGNYVSDPIDSFNHLIDPLGYVVMDRGNEEYYLTRSN